MRMEREVVVGAKRDYRKRGHGNYTKP